MNTNSVVQMKPGIQLKQWVAPGDHAFVDIVREYLKTQNVDPASVENEEELGIGWRLALGKGISILITIYKDPDGEMFFKLEAAISRMLPIVEREVFHWMAQLNADFHFPVRLALLEDRESIIIQCRSYCDGFTPEHFKIRVETLLPLSEHLQGELFTKFGLPLFIEDKDPRIPAK